MTALTKLFTKLLGHHQKTISSGMDRSDQTKTSSSPYGPIDNSTGFPATGHEPIGLINWPAEIRNAIYKYVLTSDKPLTCVMPPRAYVKGQPKIVRSEHCTMKLEKAAAHPSFNQLQFVNRQLRYDTKGLELKFNTINFPTTWSNAMRFDRFSVEGLLAFRNACPPAHFSWLRTVRVRSVTHLMRLTYTDANSEAVIYTIVNFCKANPHIEVQYVAQEFTISDVPSNRDEFEAFFHIGAALTFALRNDDSPLNEIDPHFSPTYRTSNRRWAKRTVDRVLFELGRSSSVPLDRLFSGINNFSIFPNVKVTTDVAIDYYVPDEQELDWLQWGKSWIKDGIKPCL
ncbi:hypothetical protein SLS60_008724 [Paraconiothyrium brasiliense]|uniref:Uncharacterized protein n=1 Tax=Paraconiothyrium brasiliense TaxID=300254 RepID=A0ABR3QYB5_9PLEO